MTSAVSIIGAGQFPLDGSVSVGARSRSPRRREPSGGSLLADPLRVDRGRPGGGPGSHHRRAGLDRPGCPRAPSQPVRSTTPACPSRLPAAWSIAAMTRIDGVDLDMGKRRPGRSVAAAVAFRSAGCVPHVDGAGSSHHWRTAGTYAVADRHCSLYVLEGVAVNARSLCRTS